MTDLTMPAPRDFGWALKPMSSSHFKIQQKPNGQFCVVLNHSLLRGVTSQMIHWWFLNFTRLTVRLVDVPGYENQNVPAYLLWHPIDHLSADLSGALAPQGHPKAGTKIHIREAMQYDKYGWKYPVDNALTVYYVGSDGWAMGKSLPVIGPVMMLRIHFKDVHEADRCLGVHYHYEVVIGASGNSPVSRFINQRITHAFSPEFFEAWQLHNVIEVGTFESFLPALYQQRKDVGSLMYSLDMVADLPAPETQTGYDRDLFQRRVQGYATASNPHRYQQFDQPSFL